MRVLVAGAGPGGLYFSYLLKRHHPRCEIRVNAVAYQRVLQWAVQEAEDLFKNAASDEVDLLREVRTFLDRLAELFSPA